MQRLIAHAAAACACIAPALAGPPARPAVLPANLSVEVTTYRQGGVSRRTVAKVRPGERVLLRDESDVPYARVTGARGSKGATVTSGAVVAVTPLVTGGNLSFRFETAVRTLSGFDEEPYAPDGRDTFTVRTPRVSQEAFAETVAATASPTQWSARQVAGGSGFSVTVSARPIGP